MGVADKLLLVAWRAYVPWAIDGSDTKNGKRRHRAALETGSKVIFNPTSNPFCTSFYTAKSAGILTSLSIFSSLAGAGGPSSLFV